MCLTKSFGFGQMLLCVWSFLAILASTALVAEATMAATMYWDCCKPSGSWPGKADVYSPVDVCKADGYTVWEKTKKVIGNPDSSGCGSKGDQFQCNCQQPWTDSVNPTLGYGFAAWPLTITESESECGCFLAEFEQGTPGKVDTMIVQVINIGGDVNAQSFDILVPGMGVGAQANGCSRQFNSDITKWGKQYGGLDTDKEGCYNLPAKLQEGCLWKMNEWAGNPKLKTTPSRVQCTKGHIDRSGCQRMDDQKQHVFQGKHDSSGDPAPDRYQRNPAVCGSHGSWRKPASRLAH